MKQASASSQGLKPLPDWDALAFTLTDTDFMYRARGDKSRDPVWERGELVPFGPISLSPAAAFVSYGLGVFEGLKAQRAQDGRVLLFRPDRNAARFQSSAERLLMSPFPEHQFLLAVEDVVRRNARFVPPCGRGSFYVRPLQHAVEPKLGLGPCGLFTVTIFGSPVGSYFSKKEHGEVKRRGVRLQVVEQGRVAPGGTGSAKSMGNYAGGIAIAHHWRKRGADDVLYLDARHLRFVTETSGSNVFLKRKDGTVVTPALSDQILPGVTRESAIRVAKEILGLKVEERDLPIDEVVEEGEELFCTGTAWTVQNVREIVHRGKTRMFTEDAVQKALLDVLLGIQTGTRDDPFGWTREIRLDESSVGGLPGGGPGG